MEDANLCLSHSNSIVVTIVQSGGRVLSIAHTRYHLLLADTAVVVGVVGSLVAVDTPLIRGTKVNRTKYCS